MTRPVSPDYGGQLHLSKALKTIACLWSGIVRATAHAPASSKGLDRRQQAEGGTLPAFVGQFGIRDRQSRTARDQATTVALRSKDHPGQTIFIFTCHMRIEFFDQFRNRCKLGEIIITEMCLMVSTARIAIMTQRDPRLLP